MKIPGMHFSTCRAARICCGSVLLFCMILLCVRTLSAEGAGSRASFTRGGWAGARYVASGMIGDVLCDDVFSIYWNPAGLSSLIERNRMTREEITRKARDGEIDKIEEKDLLRFSEDAPVESFLAVGISAAMLDFERNVGFAGGAFKAGPGVFGMGAYSVYSGEIEERDESGAISGESSYAAGAAYLSYAWSAGISSYGISLKGLYEKIAGTSYGGCGADFGAQVRVLPFLKISLVLADAGSFLYPLAGDAGVEKKYDFASPVLKLGVMLESDAGVIIGFSGNKKFEQDDFTLNAGIQYKLTEFLYVFLGLQNSFFSTGMQFRIGNYSISYAFMIDNIDYGYNNVLSMGMMF